MLSKQESVEQGSQESNSARTFDNIVVKSTLRDYAETGPVSMNFANVSSSGRFAMYLRETTLCLTDRTLNTPIEV
jgi:hypothetical protein